MKQKRKKNQEVFIDYLDPDLWEESHMDKVCEINLAVMSHSQQITFLQMKGSLEVSQCKHLVQLCIQSCLTVAEMLKLQIFERFKQQNELWQNTSK